MAWSYVAAVRFANAVEHFDRVLHNRSDVLFKHKPRDEHRLVKLCPYPWAFLLEPPISNTVSMSHYVAHLLKLVYELLLLLAIDPDSENGSKSESNLETPRFRGAAMSCPISSTK